jgi:AraC-like DNA-binding protein
MIYSFGITITGFLIVLLSFKSNKSEADKILLLWFFFAFVHQVLTYLDASGIYSTKFSFLIGANLPLPLIHAPFLFLYVSNLTGTSPKKKIAPLLHFLPAAIFYVYLFNFFQLPVEQKLYVMSHKGAGFEDLVILKFFAIIVSGLVYIIGSLYKIKKYQDKIKNVFSNTEKINLQWLKLLTYGIGIIWIAVFFRNDIQTSIVISLYTLVIGFFGIRQVPIFSAIPNTVNPLPTSKSDTIPEAIKYENSGLSDDKKENLKAALQLKIDENKLFLNPDLSLDMLATEIKFHPNYVSQYINEFLGFTFYDYINSKRIEEFKRQVSLPESKNLSLLGIALNCGFNSKSSFNRNFKKITGQTPTEYLDSVKNSGAS